MNKTVWSVEVEGNSYNDDLFNGTHDECMDYIKNNGFELGNGCQLAKIVIDERGCAIDTLEIEK